MNQLAKIFGDSVRIIEEDKLILPIVSAHKAVYEFNISQIAFRKMDIWMVKGGISFTIRYIAEKKNYNNDLPMVCEMVSSFDIID